MAFPEVLPIIGNDKVHCLAHGGGDKTVLQFYGKRRQSSHTLFTRKKVNLWCVGEVWSSARFPLSFTMKWVFLESQLWKSTLKTLPLVTTCHKYMEQLYTKLKSSPITYKTSECTAAILKLHCSKLPGFSRAGTELANLGWLHIASWFSTPSHVAHTRFSIA